MLRTALTLPALLFLSSLNGCGTSQSTNNSGSSSGSTAVKLQGSGASFPAPLYGRWFKQYSSETPGLRVDYQAKGSGGGIKDFIEHTVDFAASDAAMNDEEISQVDGGVVLLPMTAGSVVLAYNLPKMDKPIRLSREAYTKIFLGQILKWNDPAIQETNKAASLPDLPITVVVRADSSGTTFVFTNHLSAISKEFESGPGVGKSVSWPQGNKFIAAPKNDGVTATIMQTPGAIGYVEYGFAVQAKLLMAELENKSGNMITPTLENAEAALAAVTMPEDMRAWLPDPDGDQAYPIVSYTWLLCYPKYDDKEKAKAIQGLVRWCLTTGQKASNEMGYVALPPSVVESVQAKLKSIQ